VELGFLGARAERDEGLAGDACARGKMMRKVR